MKTLWILLFSFLLPLLSYSEENKKLKGLLVTGGGHHDYATQKDIITEEINKRISVEWDVLFEMDPRRMKGLLGTDDWAKGYDFIFYNFCFAREDDSKFIEKIVEVHKRGMPAIAMHCAMHTFHIFLRDQKPEDKSWNKMLGVVSSGHGPHVPYDVAIAEDQIKHPVVKGLPKKWRTPKGELYMVPNVLEGTKVLAYGDNGTQHKPVEPQALAWVKEKDGFKLYATTMGHHNETVASKEFLDMVANGISWATQK
ncbi:MAG: ThuA domain-containing protein [Opitutales bacterium]|nr:ThuA domain-containing protein [Opitutales bacterium]